jgi:hypothetical protein
MSDFDQLIEQMKTSERFDAVLEQLKPFLEITGARLGVMEYPDGSVFWSFKLGETGPIAEAESLGLCLAKMVRFLLDRGELVIKPLSGTSEQA